VRDAGAGSDQQALDIEERAGAEPESPYVFSWLVGRDSFASQAIIRAGAQPEGGASQDPTTSCGDCGPKHQSTTEEDSLLEGKNASGVLGRVVRWAAPWHKRSPGKAPPSLALDAPFRRCRRSLKRLPAPEAQLDTIVDVLDKPTVGGRSKRLPTLAELTPTSTPSPLITSRAFPLACLWRTSTRSPVESQRICQRRVPRGAQMKA